MQTSGSGETSPASRLSFGEVDVSNCFIVKMSRDVLCRLLTAVTNLIFFSAEKVSILTSFLIKKKSENSHLKID